MNPYTRNSRIDLASQLTQKYIKPCSDPSLADLVALLCKPSPLEGGDHREVVVNRFRREEAKKEAEAIKGLTEEEIAERNRQKDQQNRIIAVAKGIHLELFSEEYDHMCDSYADSKRRDRGENPMSEDYTNKVNARRISLGVPPLTGNGMPPNDNNSYEIALKLAKERS